MISKPSIFWNRFSKVIMLIVGAFAFGEAITPVPASATPITFSYDGIIDHTTAVNGADEAVFSAFLGKKIHIEYTFENDPSVNPDLNFAPNVNLIGVESFSITFDSNKYTSSDARLSVTNDFNTGFSTIGGEPLIIDAFRVSAQNGIGGARIIRVEGPDIAGLTPAFMGIQFIDSTTTVLSDVALPLDPPDPGAFLAAGGFGGILVDVVFTSGVSGSDPKGSVGVRENLNVSQLTAIPEPGAFALTLIGLSAFPVLRRRRQIA